MTKKEILNIIQKSKEINLKECDRFKIIFDFLQNLESNFIDILNKYESSHIRFCDYYDEGFNFDELTNYFKDNYIEKDINEQYIYFILYSIIKKYIFVLEALMTTEQNEVLEIFSNDIENILNLIKEFYLLNKVNKKQEKFDKHKYKLLFSGFSLDDVMFLDKKVTQSLVHKINNSLLEFDIVPGSERMSHVGDKYNISLFRVHLADDFRICFTRKNGVTIILGVELKSGKDINYTRYDFIAKKIDSIYLKSELLNSGKLPREDIHYKVLEEIENKFKIDKSNINTKCIRR